MSAMVYVSPMTQSRPCRRWSARPAGVAPRPRSGRADACLHSPAGEFVEEAQLAEHRTDAAHLEHQPLQRLETPARVGRQELAGLAGQVNQDGAGLEQRQRPPSGPLGSRMAGILLLGLIDRNSGVNWSCVSKLTRCASWGSPAPPAGSTPSRHWAWAANTAGCGQVAGRPFPGDGVGIEGSHASRPGNRKNGVGKAARGGPVASGKFSANPRRQDRPPDAPILERIGGSRPVRSSRQPAPARRMPAVPTMSTPIWLRPLLLPARCRRPHPARPPHRRRFGGGRPRAHGHPRPRVQRRDQGQDPRPALGAASWHAAVRRGRLRPLPGAEGAGPTGPSSRRTPYRLFLTGKDQSIRNTPDGSGVIHGVTDAQGRTAWI